MQPQQTTEYTIFTPSPLSCTVQPPLKARRYFHSLSLTLPKVATSSHHDPLSASPRVLLLFDPRPAFSLQLALSIDPNGIEHADKVAFSLEVASILNPLSAAAHTAHGLACIIRSKQFKSMCVHGI